MKVLKRSFEAFDRVAKEAKPTVACAAKDASHFPGIVAMVGVPAFSFGIVGATDGANVTLGSQERVPLLDGYPILAESLASVGCRATAIPNKSALSVLRIGVILLATLIAVGFFVALPPFGVFFSTSSAPLTHVLIVTGTAFLASSVWDSKRTTTLGTCCSHSWELAMEAYGLEGDQR